MSVFYLFLNKIIVFTVVYYIPNDEKKIVMFAVDVEIGDLLTSAIVFVY